MSAYAIMRDAIYDSDMATDATITLDDSDATEIELRALYMPSGEEVRGNMVGVGTVKMSVAVRRTELTEKGVTNLATLSKAVIAINGESWKIKSWIPFPAPTGEGEGEVRLLLTGA